MPNSAFQSNQPKNISATFGILIIALFISIFCIDTVFSLSLAGGVLYLVPLLLVTQRKVDGKILPYLFWVSISMHLIGSIAQLKDISNFTTIHLLSRGSVVLVFIFLYRWLRFTQWLHDRHRHSEPEFTDEPQEHISTLKQRNESLLKTQTALTNVMEDLEEEKERIIAEINHRKKIELSLQESEEKYRKIFENAGVGIAMVDTHGKLFITNPSLCSMLGYTADELTCMNFRDFTHPEDITKDVEQYNQLVSGSIDKYAMEKRYVSKDGHTVWADLSVSLVKTADQTYAIGLVQDITQRKYYESELIDGKDRFEMVIRGTKDGVWDQPDLNNPTQWWSPRLYEILGYSPNSVSPTSDLLFDELMHDIDRRHVLSTVKQCTLTNTPMDLDCRIKTGDGSYKWFRLRGTVSENEKETISTKRRFAGSIADIDDRKQTENRLRESHLELQRLNAIFSEIQSFARLGVWEVDLESDEVFWTDQVYDIHEIKRGTAINLEMGINFYHPEYREIISSAVQQAITEHKTWDLELKIITAEKNELWVRAAGLPVIENGKVIKLRGLFMDIHSRKRAEEQNRISLLVNEMALSAGNIGVWVWDIGAKKMSWNEQMHEIFDWPEDKFKSSLADFTDRIHNEDLDFVTLALEDALAGNQEFNEEYRILTQAGETHHMMSKSKMVRDHQGEKIKLIGVCSDITWIKQGIAREQALKEQLGLFVKHSPARVVMLDHDLNCLIASDRWIENYSPSISDPTEKNFKEIMPGLAASENWESMLLKCLNGQMIKENEAHVTNDEDAIWLKYEIYPWYNVDNEIGGVGLFVEDITMAKTYEMSLEKEIAKRTAQLEATNKELESFSYSVSHDLRAPLRVIDGFSRIILEDYGEVIDEEGKDTIQSIISNVHKMGKLIDSLLTFSRVGRKGLNIGAVSFEGLIGEVMKDLSHVEDLSTHEVRIINQLDTIYGDRSLLKQVFTNLASNAVKYSKKSAAPAVTITAETIDGHAQITFKDNGAGFDMKYYDKLFGVFQRLHGYDEFEGTGVGLALVKKIVERHDGKIWAEGMVNEGACFYVSLPLTLTTKIDVRKHEDQI